MKKSLFLVLICITLFIALTSESCQGDGRVKNTSALDEQAHTEVNQQRLNKVIPPPDLDYSLERQNIKDREVLQNDRTVMFFLYIFIEGDRRPVGYYQVNKVSSVNSQLTNTQQLVEQWVGSGGGHYVSGVLPSPAEDGSYGTNGEGMFGFTPEGIYVESNMKYIAATVPLNFPDKPQLLAVITSEEAKSMLANTKKVIAKANQNNLQ